MNGTAGAVSIDSVHDYPEGKRGEGRITRTYGYSVFGEEDTANVFETAGEILDKIDAFFIAFSSLRNQ